MNYGYTTYGNTTKGYEFYDKPRDAVEATDGFLVSKVIYKMLISSTGCPL